MTKKQIGRKILRLSNSLLDIDTTYYSPLKVADKIAKISSEMYDLYVLLEEGKDGD